MAERNDRLKNWIIGHEHQLAKLEKELEMTDNMTEIDQLEQKIAMLKASLHRWKDILCGINSRI